MEVLYGGFCQHLKEKVKIIINYEPSVAVHGLFVKDSIKCIHHQVDCHGDITQCPLFKSTPKVYKP